MNVGSPSMLITLRRGYAGQSWGFRLQGGSDFTTPLSVQLVNPGGVAEQSGLQAGDAVLRINDKPTESMDHEDAKQEIIMAQDSVNLLIQRGTAKIWRPKVTPLCDLKSGPAQQLPVGPDGEIYVQKTSLAADPSKAAELTKIGGGHNRTARPFPTFGGGASSAPATAQLPMAYNSGGGSGGSVGGGSYGTASSDTYQQQTQQRLQMSNLTLEEDVDAVVPGRPRAPSPAPPTTGPTVTPPVDSAPLLDANANVQIASSAIASSTTPRVSESVPESTKQSRSFMMLEQELSGPSGGANLPSGMRSVAAPITQPGAEKQTGQYITCKVCGMLIAGVFVKIKGNPMHPECFKCCECGKNLKNKGYFDIGGQLYCEVHATQAAQPPGPDMVAVPTYR